MGPRSPCHTKAPGELRLQAGTKIETSWKTGRRQRGWMDARRAPRRPGSHPEERAHGRKRLRAETDAETSGRARRQQDGRTRTSHAPPRAEGSPKVKRRGLAPPLEHGGAQATPPRPLSVGCGVGRRKWGRVRRNEPGDGHSGYTRARGLERTIKHVLATHERQRTSPRR